MNFSETILTEQFQKAYNDAIKYKNIGNLKLAKDCFLEASEALERLAAIAKDPEDAETKKNRAERLKTIALAIDVTKSYTPQNNVSFSGVNNNLYSVNNNAQSGTYSQNEETDEKDEEMSQYLTFFTSEELTDGFDMVIGLEEAKDAITEYVINPIKYKDAYNYKFQDNKAVLLEGPPGTGKTTFAKAVAKEINQPFALINVAALVNCYIGETGKNIDKVFAYLRDYVEKNNCGLTVFFDELDEIAKQRGGDDKASASAVPALLRNMDGVKANKDFLILANTNCMEMLDKGILDRFRKRIHIPLPDAAMRYAFFKNKLKDIEQDFIDKLDFEALANNSEGLSGRSITYICDDFKYYISGVKAGIKNGDDLNSVLVNLIDVAKKTSGIE